MRVPLQLLGHVFCTSTRVPVPNLVSISRFLYQNGLLTFNLWHYLFIICLIMRVPLRFLAPSFCTSIRVPVQNLESICRFLYQRGLFPFNLRLYLFINCLLCTFHYGSWHMYSTQRLEYLFKIWNRYVVSCTRQAFFHLIYGFICL